MSYINYHNYDLSNSDFNVIQYGYRDCVERFTVYYRKPENYIFHYVYGGKGDITVKGITYELSEGMGFMLFPGVETWYSSDEYEPYSYAWIEFSGSKAASFVNDVGFSPDCPVIKINPPQESGTVLKSMSEAGGLSRLALTGNFYLFANALTSESSMKTSNYDPVFHAAQSYIHNNISKNTTVNDVCKAVGVSRSYLSKLFARCISQTPKQYILRYHMNEAVSLLKGTDMTIAEIAEAVGYINPTDFTKTFVRFAGQSPTKFRRENRI